MKKYDIYTWCFCEYKMEKNKGDKCFEYKYKYEIIFIEEIEYFQGYFYKYFYFYSDKNIDLKVNDALILHYDTGYTHDGKDSVTFVITEIDEKNIINGNILQ